MLPVSQNATWLSRRRPKIKGISSLLRLLLDFDISLRPSRCRVRPILLALTLAFACHCAQSAPTANPASKQDRPIPDASQLNLRSAAVLVADDRGHILYGKQIGTVKPIASITKLMTALVVLDAGVSMNETIAIREEDRDRLRFSRSRLRIGKARLSRGEMLTVALMSSDNRAAAALGRTTFPGGSPAFAAAMNLKAEQLGMKDSRFVEPTGLDGGNVSTAADLAKLVRAAADYPFIRAATTRARLQVQPYESGGTLEYRNTNPLVRNENPDWSIGLSKTGYLNEAGRCLVMQANIEDRPLYIVLLDSFGKLTPVGDSNRLRKWLEAGRRGPQ